MCPARKKLIGSRPQSASAGPWARWCSRVALLASLAAPAGAAPILHLQLGTGVEHVVVTTGTTLTVRVLASGIPPGSDGLGLFGFGFGVSFDAVGIAVGIPVLGPLWNGTGFAQVRHPPGEVGLLANRFFESAGPSGDGILLGTFEVTVLQPGFFALDAGYFTGAGDTVLFDGSVLDASPQSFFRDASIRVVPAVPSLALAPRVVLATLLALLALPAVRRDRTPLSA